HDGVARYFASKLPDWVAMERGRKTAIRFAVRYAVLAVASIPIVTVLAIVGLRVMVPESYAGGSDLLMWLVPAQSLAGVARLFSGFLYVEHRTRHRAALSAAEASFNIALTWPLVVLYGAAGAAAATLATYAVSMVGTVMLAMRGPTLRGVSPVRNPS
ncbi:MAG: polysaccharide biosynthesis C-terminal domain-containing protein, partial [Acidimicrobiia bacterium]|nr:polysaccharide biosynthesis C-terminal domain-containing protein [Acidimicrobiia bacterium]